MESALLLSIHITPIIVLVIIYLILLQMAPCFSLLKVVRIGNGLNLNIHRLGPAIWCSKPNSSALAPHSAVNRFLYKN